MTRWLIPSIAVLVVLVVGAVIVGCQPQQTGSEVAAAPPADATAATPVADQAAAGGEAHAVASAFTYTCPMHPDVKQDRPGTCPECGMFLVADTDQTVEYYCPMHPDVVQKDPGKCPQCGMFLEARPAPEQAD